MEFESEQHPNQQGLGSGAVSPASCPGKIAPRTVGGAASYPRIDAAQLRHVVYQADSAAAASRSPILLPEGPGLAGRSPVSVLEPRWVPRGRGVGRRLPAQKTGSRAVAAVHGQDSIALRALRSAVPV